MPRRSERTPTFRALAGVVVPPLSAMADIRLHHAERVPQTGAFVLAPNHMSEIDPIVVGAALWKAGRAPRFLAKESLFGVPGLGAIMRATGQVPVDRTGITRDADPMAAARALAEQERSIIIYPEGTLTRDPDLWPMRGKTGAVRMALQASVPIVPVAHWGAQRLMPRYGRGIRPFPRKRIDVLFGEPVDLDAYRGGPLDQATLLRATDEVMRAITDLLVELRGEPAPAERWDPSKRGQSETGRFDG
ncbi:lysophospholipid acyltransferase family protein [Agrococcus versicolor]|uniref:Lysophospholipid acyltransferase family protein n=1 Tax=Agrococcus versicolor TaxID=501482 RepID=A0ABN3ALP4_9MICO